MSVFYLLSLITLTLLTKSYEVQAQIEEIGTEITFPPDIEIDSESSTLLPDIAMSSESESSSILPDIVTTYSESSTFDYSSINEITISESEIGDISTNPLPSDKDVISSVSSSDITEFSELPQPAIGNNIPASSDSSKNKKSWLNTAIIIAIIALLVIAVIIAILVFVICKLMKKSANTSVDDSEIKPEDIEAQQVIEPESMEPIGEEAIKQEEDQTIRSTNVEPVVTPESQQTDESKQSPKEDTPIETPIQDSKETPKDETKQLASQQKPQKSLPEEEDTNVMYVIDGRKRTIK